MADTFNATCFCGEVGIEATGEPVEMGYCHCRSCRSWSGGPFNTFTLWPEASVRLTRGADRLGQVQKSPMSVRRFCTECGGHVMIEHPTLGLTDIPSSILRGLTFRPSFHLNYAETVHPMKDGLPKLRDVPAEIGGSGETVPE